MTFDWLTFAVQIANVLILLAILRHVLFRPVAAMIAERQRVLTASLGAAEAAEARAHAAEAEAAAAAAETLRQRPRARGCGWPPPRPSPKCPRWRACPPCRWRPIPR
uniref:hypothetical protein n=1 Tax=Cereibacter sphaeroides TaxID=1063 RepID=UPI001E29B38D|nr:hypothetical protein [Cereibacter sphaeroides]